MHRFLIIILTTACLGSAYAFELGTQLPNEKTNSHVGQNPGTPDAREGGEDMATAFLITEIPFYDTGNTTGHVDDYDATCPYDNSTAPDLVYKYCPQEDIILSVDLCGSSYDTKTYILDPAFNIIACNDDAYSDEICGVYVSLIENAELTGGETYFFVIDGYGIESGDYILNVTEFFPEPPCVLECDGVAEGEPALGPGYEDAFNGGCNSPEFGMPWGDLTHTADAYGNLIFCGIAGWTGSGRDTDWNYFMMGEEGIVELTVDSEQPLNFYTLTMTHCDDASIGQGLSVGSCNPGAMSIQGQPHDVIMMWFGAAEFTPPSDFEGYEFRYVAEFSGLYETGCTISTESATIDRIKSLYR